MSDAFAEIDRICAPESEGGLPGWCTPEKGRWIAEHVVREHLTRCAEIGVFGGRSLLSIALGLRELGRGFVVGVDPYDLSHQIENVDRTAHIEWARDIPFETIYTSALAELRRLGLQSHCGILRAGAAECAGVVGTLDLLHIDGCHSVAAACRDVELWAPKVRSGGIIVLDDVTWDTVQPARAILAAMCEPPVQTSDPGWEAYRRL